jgi:hypothetical protein
VQSGRGVCGVCTFFYTSYLLLHVATRRHYCCYNCRDSNIRKATTLPHQHSKYHIAASTHCRINTLPHLHCQQPHCCIKSAPHQHIATSTHCRIHTAPQQGFRCKYVCICPHHLTAHRITCIRNCIPAGNERAEKDAGGRRLAPARLRSHNNPRTSHQPHHFPTSHHLHSPRAL